jgi:hypothetical protein
MSYYTQLEDALYSICAQVFDGIIDEGNIIHENPNAPEPTGNYLLIGIRDVQSMSQFSQTTTVDSLNNTLRHRKVYQCLVDFNAYGSAAYDNASLLEAQFETEDLRNTLWSLGISVKRVGAMKRMPVQRETQYVNRGLIQTYFYFGYEFEETVNDTIDSVDLDVNQILN